jgi:hypothetical protein
VFLRRRRSHCAPTELANICRIGGYKHLTSKGVAVRSDYCENSSTGIYSVPSLAPTDLEVRQVENEAGDCEVRLPLIFYTDY